MYILTGLLSKMFIALSINKYITCFLDLKLIFLKTEKTMFALFQWYGRPQFNSIWMTQKTVLDAALLNNQHYKVRIKAKI